MDKISACCGSFCGCFGNVLRKKTTLYLLMFLCLFWATFDLVLSSMSINQVYDRDPKRATVDVKECSPKDACAGECGLAFVDVSNPFEFYVADKGGNQFLKMLCTWPIGPNASRFCCAISCIIMFFSIGVWVCRTPYPRYSKIFHVLLFIAADCWWWAVMVTDATLVIKANDSCKIIQKRLTNDATVANVRHHPSYIRYIDRAPSITVLQCPNNILTYTVLCDAACALFFLLLPISTFMCPLPVPFLLPLFLPRSPTCSLLALQVFQRSLRH
jgi:hypothetical protein